jgi:NADH dehydrogenase
MANVFLKDVVVTWEEIKGLMAGLLVSKAEPKGRMRFSQWLEEHKQEIGTRYASELTRHYR